VVAERLDEEAKRIAANLVEKAEGRPESWPGRFREPIDWMGHAFWEEQPECQNSSDGDLDAWPRSRGAMTHPRGHNAAAML
jgi:hypothetical protein